MRRIALMGRPRHAVEFCERWLGRAHLASWLLEWRTEVIVAASIVISGMYGLWEYIREINPLIVSLGVVIVFAVLMFGLNQAHKLYVRLRKPKSAEASSTRPTKFGSKLAGRRIETPINFADSTPDLRVADDRSVIELFDGDERDKLLPLLESEKVAAWARRMGSGEPPLTKLSGQLWKTHYLLSLPREGQWDRAQTFLKTKARSETSYYDLYLNEVQIASLWPEYEKISLLDAARLAYEAAEEAGLLSLTTPTYASPAAKLNHFKLLFMIDEGTDLFGIKPPSTKSRLILKSDLQGHDLYPVEGDSSQINHLIPADRIAYTDVTLRRKNLHRVIDGYIAEGRQAAT